MKYSVLLPNYNNEPALPVFFQKLAQLNDLSEVELVFVDDGSEDNSLKVLKRLPQLKAFHTVKIEECAHEGIVVALNHGLARCTGEIVLRVDGDATAEMPDWIRRLASKIETDESVGLVGTPVITDSGILHSLGRGVICEEGLHDMGCTPWEEIGQRTFDSHVLRPFVSPRHVIKSRYREVDALLGVCTAFRRSDALALGGFDIRFNPVWIEDDDFAFAMRASGKRVLVDDSILVLHRYTLRNSREPGKTKHGFSGLLREGKRAMRRSIGLNQRDRLIALKAGVFHHMGRTSKVVETPSNQWRSHLLSQHYKTWQKKWGFHPLNPDLAAIAAKYSGTPVCWNMKQNEPELIVKSFGACP